MSSAEAR